MTELRKAYSDWIRDSKDEPRLEDAFNAGAAWQGEQWLTKLRDAPQMNGRRPTLWQEMADWLQSEKKDLAEWKEEMRLLLGDEDFEVFKSALTESDPYTDHDKAEFRISGYGLEILRIVNEPGMTWKVRRALLREKGFSEVLIDGLVGKEEKASDY